MLGSTESIQYPAVTQIGQYSLEKISQFGTQYYRIWRDGQGHEVKELMGKENDPFSSMYIDFDGTMVFSEEPSGFFDAVWAGYLNEVGFRGSIEEISKLRWQVYKWHRNVLISTQDMLGRIEQEVDVRGNPLSEEALVELNKLLKLDPREIADRKEALGVELIRGNPKLVEQLAPLNPGFVSFMNRLPPEMPLYIGSASRKTTIEPILEALDFLHPEYKLRKRFGDRIFGEEDMIGQTKPDDSFFQVLCINTAFEMHRSGSIPPGMVYSVDDMLFVGDRGDIDIPRNRRMYYLIVNPNDQTPTYGPLTAIVPDFTSVLEMKRGLVTNNLTLQRLVKTIQ